MTSDAAVKAEEYVQRVEHGGAMASEGGAATAAAAAASTAVPVSQKRKHDGDDRKFDSEDEYEQDEETMPFSASPDLAESQLYAGAKKSRVEAFKVEVVEMRRVEHVLEKAHGK